MLNEMEIKKHCDINGFDYRYFYTTSVITTGTDTWRLTQKEVRAGDLILVEHANKAGNKSGKMQFHTQRVAYDIDWIFNNIIVPHETYSNVYDKAFKVKQLLAQV